MRVVITGGTGFLGRHIVQRLAVAGHEVVFTGRNGKTADGIMAGIRPAVSFAPLAHGTPQAAAEMGRICRGAGAVVHCAALSAPWGRAQDFHDAYVASAQEVVDACRDGGVPRLVHISTPSLYACRRDRLGIREDDPLPEPVNEYARTKLAAERIAAGADLAEVVVLRPRAIFGPCDETLLPRLLRILSKGVVPLVRGAQTMTDVTYVANVVDAVEAALCVLLPRPRPVYNITNGEPMPMAELFALLVSAFDLRVRPLQVPRMALNAMAATCEALACVTGKDPVLTRYSAGVLSWSQTLDITAARQELGYAPRVSVRDGLKAYAAWWRARSA